VSSAGSDRGWTHLLEEVLSQAAQVSGGRVAEYIPALSQIDPDLLGLAAVTPDGGVQVAGDHDTPFTLMSATKPFVYGVSLSACVQTDC
jgi:glutaminase